MPALLDGARLFHTEIGDEIFLPFDADKTAFFLADAVKRGLAIGVERKGELIGALVLFEAAPRYSSTPVLWDMGFYVKPKYRGTRAAIMLCDAAKAIAADMGMPLIVGVSSGIDLDRKDKFFNRAGFRRVGALYLWR